MRKRELVLGLLVGMTPFATPAQPTAGGYWIDRPWEYRYVLHSKDWHGAQVSIKHQRPDYASRQQSGKRFFDPYAIFDITGVITVRPSLMPELREGDLATLIIEFDASGQVLTPHLGPADLAGRIVPRRSVELLSLSNPRDMEFNLGWWYLGRSGEDAIFAPAICTEDDKNLRYKRRFKPDTIVGTFGCREWGYYLQSPAHPYIDVTSYEPPDQVAIPVPGHPKGAVMRTFDTFIRDFVGWGRFDIPPKPVIGKHEDKWVCLHECPDGEAPGVIPDIKAWAAKRGWPVPERPKRMPMFTDKPYKKGEFVD